MLVSSCCNIFETISAIELIRQISGGPTAAIMAFQNPHINVTVVDRDPVRIKQWKSKHLPIYEPGLHEILRIARDGSKPCAFYNEVTRSESLDSMSSTSSAESECESQCGEHRDEIAIPARIPNLFFSTEISKTISEADIVLIAINTPTKMRGLGWGKATDVTALEAVTMEIAIHAQPGAILVEKSTVPCRTAELIQDTVCPIPPAKIETTLIRFSTAKSPPPPPNFRSTFQPRIPRRRNSHQRPPLPRPGDNRLIPHTCWPPCSSNSRLRIRIMGSAVQNRNHEYLVFRTLKTSSQLHARATNQQHQFHLCNLRENGSGYR